MAKFTHHHNHGHSPRKKLAFVASLSGLVGAALIADFFWASSSSTSAYLSLASNWAREKSGIIVFPNVLPSPEAEKVCLLISILPGKVEKGDSFSMSL